MDSLPDYIVVRPAADLPEGFLPPGMDGRWYDRRSIPVSTREPVNGIQGGISVSSAVAVPVDRFEVREDGAVAQVWEMRP